MQRGTSVKMNWSATHDFEDTQDLQTPNTMDDAKNREINVRNNNNNAFF